MENLSSRLTEGQASTEEGPVESEVTNGADQDTLVVAATEEELLANDEVPCDDSVDQGQGSNSTGNTNNGADQQNDEDGSEDRSDDDDDPECQCIVLETGETAIFAWSIRPWLIRRGLREAGGNYENTPACSAEFEWDFTAPCPGQLDLNEPTDDERHAALTIHKPTDRRVDSPVPGPLIFYNYLVVNLDLKPLRDLQHLPLTISSQVEGFRLVAWSNLNPRIMDKDIVDRLPVRIINGQNGEITRKPAYRANALSIRRLHAREELNILPRWERKRRQHPDEGDNEEELDNRTDVAKRPKPTQLWTDLYH